MRRAFQTRPRPNRPAPLPGGGTARVRRSGHLPDLAAAPPAPVEVPAEPAPTLEQVFRLTQSSARDESTDFRERSEARDPCAFLTVYAINAAIMLFAFPVGFALLVFNILGGENLRTTSHVMGLTGLATALPYLGYNVPFLT